MKYHHLGVWPSGYLFQCSNKPVAFCILLGSSEPLGCSIHIPHIWFRARMIVFYEVSRVGLDVSRGCRTRRFFLSEPLWGVFNSWIANLQKKGTWLWPQGTKAEEDLVSLVCLQRYVNPPVHCVEGPCGSKLGHSLAKNTRARDGATWGPVLSKNLLTASFSKLFCWQPSGASFAPIRKVRDHHTVTTGLGVLVSSWCTVAFYVLF